MNEFKYRIYGVSGYPLGFDDFASLEAAIKAGMEIHGDLFSVKNMNTGEIEWSNFISI